MTRQKDILAGSQPAGRYGGVVLPEGPSSEASAQPDDFYWYPSSRPLDLPVVEPLLMEAR